MNVKKVGIIGGGAMGISIAQAFAQIEGFSVALCSRSAESAEQAKNKIGKNLEKRIAKGKLGQVEADAILARISTGTKELCADFDLVIETVIENLDIKLTLLSELDAICKPETIFASNTSTMSITKLASATQRPDRMVGMHFFNPAYVMKLVEVIKGYYTSDEIVDQIKEVIRYLGKESIVVKKDSPGFVVNRLMLAQFREAFLVYEEGIASIEDIDKAMELGLNHPMGPFALMDFTGNDIAYDTLMSMYTEMALPNWAPPTALKRIVNAGNYGKKVGKGWYDYNKEENEDE